MSVERCFPDTNVLVYAHDLSEPVKGPRAVALLDRIWVLGKPLLSVQVLSEFYSVTTRKLPRRLSAVDAAAAVDRLCHLSRVVPLTASLVQEAIRIVGRHGLSPWDGQIIAAAARHQAEFVISEDLSDGAVIGGVTVVNPFASDLDYRLPL